jgi:Arc/MetJ-type ribon-helix-helix transcriptional regulator
MIRLPQVITVRLDEPTVARIRERVGEGYRVRNLSQFIREGIRLRMDQPDEYTGWLVSRSIGQTREV